MMTSPLLSPGSWHFTTARTDSLGVFEGSEARQTLLKAILDNLAESDFKTLADDALTDLVPTIDSLEDASRLMPGLEGNAGAWAWLRAHPIQFSSLGNVMSLSELVRLIEWRCIKINLPMLSLVCAKSEGGQGSKSSKTEAGDVGVMSFRRLQALGVDGLIDLLLSHADEFVAALLDQAAPLDESSESLASLLAELDTFNDLATRLFDHTTCELRSIQDAPMHLWAKALESDRFTAKSDAVWTYFDEIIATERHAAGDESGLNPATVFAGFIARNALQLKGNLWQSTSEDLALLQYLLRSSDISNDVLKALLDGVVLRDLSVLKDKMPEGRWVMLVTSTFLPYSSEVRDVVLASCRHLEGQYLAERLNLAKAEVDIGSLQLESMITLSKSNALPLTQKIQMWSGLTLEVIESRPEAVSELGRVATLANQVGERFADSLMPVLRNLVRSASLTSEHRSEMLVQCLPGMKWPDVSAALALLDDADFKTVSHKVKKIKVRNTETNWRLLSALKAGNYLAKLTQEDDIIIATTRPSSMTDQDGWL